MQRYIMAKHPLDIDTATVMGHTDQADSAPGRAMPIEVAIEPSEPTHLRTASAPPLVIS
jgi:hypothetical protein